MWGGRWWFAGVLLAAAACGVAADEAGDGRDDAFGGKADRFGAVLSDAVLALVNEDSLSVDELDVDARLNRVAAENIVAYRAGDDGVLGTDDDRRFATLAELDAVPFVGPVALESLSAYAVHNRQPLDLYGLVTGTSVSGLELPDDSFRCLLFVATERYGTVGLSAPITDCFAASFSEHPDDELSSIRIPGAELSYVTDADELADLKALEPGAFYFHHRGLVEPHGPTYSCNGVGLDSTFIEFFTITLGGETLSLGHGAFHFDSSHPLSDTDGDLDLFLDIEGADLRLTGTAQSDDAVVSTLVGAGLEIELRLRDGGGEMRSRRGEAEAVDPISCTAL